MTVIRNIIPLKRNFLSSVALACVVLTSAGRVVAQVQGASSSQSPYMLPVAAGVQTISIFTAGDVVGGYRMVGTPDGLGAYSNGNGTFTILMNHEIGPSDGAVHAHGATGSFVSQWTIQQDPLNLTVLAGRDLATTVVTSGSTALSRLCSADLAAMTAFYNPASGLGTQSRIFLNGEEVRPEGRALGFVVDGANGRTAYELPSLGRFAHENAVANPFAQDKTLVMGLDDDSPGQLYLYVGNKTAVGNDVERAGLTNGSIYGVRVNNFGTTTANGTESRSNPFNGLVKGGSTGFELSNLGDASGQTGATLDFASDANSVTEFLRPEDGVWDPTRPSDFYFVTTDRFNDSGQVGRSRLWRLRFADLAHPELGGALSLLLDGTEGQQMMDNITMDRYGHLLIQEDPGNVSLLARVLQYDTNTGDLSVIAQHDPLRFSSAGAQFITQDEESSGIIDAQDILGAGWFLLDVQVPRSVGGEVVSGGQLLALFNPSTAASALAPEPASGLLLPSALLALSGCRFIGSLRRRRKGSPV